MFGLAKADVLVSQQLQDIFKKLESDVAEIAGQKMLISLCVFNPEPGSHVNYISNGKRDDVAGAWISMIEGWRAGMPDIPAHQIN